jgi:hypothetical protein
MDYYEHFKNQEGSDLPIFRGARNQRGHGLGNWFRSFFRYVVPLLKKHAVPVLKKGATIIGTEAIKTAANVSTDKIAGKKFEEASRTRVNEGLENISKQWNQKGSGKRKKKKKIKKREVSLNQNRKKLRRLKDIFDTNV